MGGNQLPFKSPTLQFAVNQAFGPDGEVALHALMRRAGDAGIESMGALMRLIDTCDNHLSTYARHLDYQSRLSGDAFSDWNLVNGRIESGRKWKTLLGYPNEAIADTIDAWEALVHPEDFPDFRRDLNQRLASGSEEFQFDLRLRNHHGDWCWFLIRGLVMRRDPAGVAQRLLVMHRDINEVRRSQDNLIQAREFAEAANKARGAFLANMSHEIRTPMNGIIGMSELLMDTELNDEQQKYLTAVKSSAEGLLTIINDILDFSKVEAGKLEFESIGFYLSDLVLDAARSLAVSAHAKGLDVVVDIAPDVPPRLLGDPTRLRQVLTNLIANAVKFTEAGEIALGVTVDRRTTDSVFLNFSVRDTGIGIPQEAQKQIFEAFSQADSTTTRRFGGTGLGLAICAQLVTMMDGRIGVTSQPGAGSEFYFDARFGIEPTARTELAGSLAGRCALIIGEHMAVTANLTRLLSELGVSATTLVDVGEAFELMGTARNTGQPIDFVFVEADMRPPAGFAIVRDWERKTYGEKLILILGSDRLRTHLQTLRETPAVRHLVKPIGLGDLYEVIAPDAVDTSTTLELAPIELEEAPDPTKALKVLLVEDNLVNQQVATRLLEKSGHQVTVANNGAEALQVCEHGRFDVILMDMQMPVMGGIEATEALRAKEMRRSWVIAEDVKPVYIIAMTANVMSGDRERCLDAGMNDFVGKPVRSAELNEALARAVEAREREDDD